MLNLVSLIIGGVALVLAGIAFIPLLGWANWLIIPLAIIGAGIGMVSRGGAGRQPQPSGDRDRDRPADDRRRPAVSRDPRVDAYIAKAAAFARPVLEHIRERVHAAVPDVEETIKWGAPSFTLGGKILLMTAAFKAHAALNFWRGQELRGSKSSRDAMGQFGKLTELATFPPIPSSTPCFATPGSWRGVLLHPARPSMRPSRRHKCIPTSPLRWPRRPRPRPRSTLLTLGAARLSRMDWGGEQDATRQKRIVTSIEWLNEGKKRHWKYENC